METEAPKKKRKITKKQKDWADKYIETGNKTQSALAVYDTEDYKTASVIGAENIEKPSVREYLENHAHEAALRIRELSKQDDERSVALGASKDILDRAGFKPIEKSINVNYDVPKNPEKAKQFDEWYKQQLAGN